MVSGFGWTLKQIFKTKKIEQFPLRSISKNIVDSLFVSNNVVIIVLLQKEIIKPQP